MIILEGPDKGGKSTLGERLSKDLFEMPVRNFGIPTGDPIPDYVAELLARSTPAMYDRFLYGEYPYSRVKRPHAVYMKDFELAMLELMLLTKPHVVVYCRPPWEEIVRRFSEEADEYITDLAQLREIVELYDELFAKAFANVIFYDGTDATYPMVIQHCREAINHSNWNEHNAWRRHGMPGIGSIKSPRWLFVGEKYNWNAEHQITFWSKSGEYLLNTLAQAGVYLPHCHFTNSISADIQRLELSQILMLNPERVICLGDIAWATVSRFKDELEDVNIQINKIHHPAYWSRFRSGDQAEYIEGVKLACAL